MTVDARGIFAALESHALASGLFEKVDGHEPKSAPAAGMGGLYAAVWVDRVEPWAAQSGLTATTGRVVLNLRVYSNMLQEPQDAIDPAIVGAVDALLTAYSGDFTLGGLIREVDLLGASGAPLAAQSGYLQQDNRWFRVMTITVPCIVDNAWTQAP